MYRTRAQVYRPGVHEEVGHEGQHNPHHRQGRHHLQDGAAEVQGTHFICLGRGCKREHWLATVLWVAGIRIFTHTPAEYTGHETVGYFQTGLSFKDLNIYLPKNLLQQLK